MAVDVGRAMAQAPTTDALWSAALLDLLSSRPNARTLDRAIGRLSEVLSRDTTNAAVLNDLAAAYLMRAGDRDDARDLFVAVDYVERAYARDSVSPVIRFNRAMLLEHSRLEAMAHEAWAVAATDPDDGWANEARAHLGKSPRGSASRVTIDAFDAPGVSSDTLRRLVRHDPQTAREFVWDSLTTRWSSAVLRGDTSAAAIAVRQGLGLGAELVAHAGDSSVAHMALELKAATRVRSVALAVANVAKGTTLFRQARNGEAGLLLADAVRALRNTEFTALADWADLGLAGVELQRGSYAAAERIFADVAHRARGRNALAFEGRARWGMALSQGRRGAASETEQSYSVAVERFSRLGETSNVGFMQALVADIHHALGRPAAHARAMYVALDAFSRRPAPSLRYAVLLAHSQRLGDRGLHSAAAVTIREAIAMARVTGRSKDYPEALARMALEQVRLDDRQGAARSLQAARDQLVLIADKDTRDRLDVELARAEAVAYRDDPRRALERSDYVTRYFQRLNIPVDIAPSLVDRADMRLVLGDSAGALADLDHAIRAITSIVPRQADRDQVRRVREAQAGVFRRLVAISIARHDTAAAFQYAELARSDSLGASETPAIPDAMPADKATVAYLAVGNRMYIWTIGASGRPAVTVAPAEVPEIGALANRFLNLIRDAGDERTEKVVAAELFALLIRPVMSHLTGVRRLTIVSDASVADVPFAALRDDTGNYLVGRFALRYARRATALHGHREGARAAGYDGVLLVGNPKWDPSLFPELGQLRGADREIDSIRSLYARVTVLSGTDATRSNVIKAFPVHSLVHFAGHARVALDEPMASHLVVARDTSGFAGNVVFASDLVRLPLKRVRLAILSACGSPGDRFTGQPTNGLIQALLDAGAAAVIGSQWEADDESTADLMRDLHGELRRGGDPADALQRAQIDYARTRGARSVRQWSGFRLTVN